MTITLVTLEQAETKQGVVFWWSNILRGYQLRIYPPSQTPPHQTIMASAPEVTGRPGIGMAQIYLSRSEVETAAFSLANYLRVVIYEIEIPHLNPAANE